jgi:hypothetical protein
MKTFIICKNNIIGYLPNTSRLFIPKAGDLITFELMPYNLPPGCVPATASERVVIKVHYNYISDNCHIIVEDQ